MRFVFVHTEERGINLQRLHDGTERGAGSVARLRLLFWLAARGHEVYAAGNIENGLVAGVHGINATDDTIVQVVRELCDADTLVVFNNFPDRDRWADWKGVKRAGVRLAVWAGNPFVPSEWMPLLTSGELDRIVCVSKTHRDWYRIYRGFSHVEYSYSGVDTDLIARATPRPRSSRAVLSISMPRRTKGFHHLLAAWRIVRQQVPDAMLRVCGTAAMHDANAPVGKTGILDAALEEEFQDFFGDYPASAQAAGIELLGSIEMSAVHTEIKSAAMAVVNCNWRESVETYCRAAVEAQVAGTPVVGAYRGSLQEVVCNGVTGVMVDQESEVALAEAIVGLLTDADRRVRMGEAGVGWAHDLAEYAVIAPDWEGIAARAKSGAPAPSGAKMPEDLLRIIGYGYLRMAARRLKERLQGA